MEEAENADDAPIPAIDETSTSPAKSCALCGCSTPAVRCDRCSSQIFCLSCDDMYHRHPKRRLHLRKAVDSIWNSSKSPRLRRRTELPGDPSKIPIPPPRSKKRDRHTVGGRLFLKQSHELGSFGHSKMFDLRTIAPPSKDIFAGQKTSPTPGGTYENETNMATSVVEKMATGNDIYENENIPMNTGENVDNSNSMGQAPWNMPRTNISSPIQVSIPSSSPDMITNGQSFGYPMKPQSRSIADLTGAPPNPIGTHPYHLPHYPYMHPPLPHPPYSHSMAHLNCAQCMSSSWSNLMSPHPSPYFHPMPWGSANASLARGHPGANGQVKHGSVPSFPDPNFHFPYPGGAFYANGTPVVDPNFARDFHQQVVEPQKVKRSPSGSRQTLSPENPENMDIATDSAPEVKTDDNPAPKEANRRKQEIDEEKPKIPEPPSQPWSCLHCTYVNPPGIHICEICCKTSYGNAAQSENQNEGRSLDSRNSDSPMELVNLDALSQSPDFIKQRPQKDEGSIGADSLETEEILDTKDHEHLTQTPDPSIMLTTETQTSTTTKSTDVQTQKLVFQSIASSTDSIFPKQEISVQTDTQTTEKNNSVATVASVATDPMISSQSMESLMSGFSAPPYQNRRAGWGRGASFSTQSLYERGRSKSPIPRSLSEAQSFVRDSSLPPEEAMHSWSQAWLMSDPMYYKPHNPPGYGQTFVKEDYFDGTWGSMDKLNRRVNSKQGKKSEVNPRPKFHRSLDDLKAEKTQDVIHSRELQFLQTVKEAERCGFSLEDLHVAYLHCGKENPVFWLEDNWSFMIKNVIALAAKYGEDNEENDVGVLTASEAKQALHIHRGDIWDAVTECIENRQRKILELTVRGNFTQKQIADALKNNEGNVELAYADLLRASTRRHKFILSPGLSEDSEYNPVDESTGDHSVPIKAGKPDILTDTKADKKKSDFLTKLSSIRQAQSERRKAREEKEMIRESTTQEVPDTLETKVESPQSENVKLPRTEESSNQDPIAEEPVGDIEKELADAKLEFDRPVKDSAKKDNEDNVPEDYDTNWVESQGEWIEEYSDEQWDEEGDGQWVSLQKKYQSMEKEFEEEAKQMAALWEKEELEDDVFEEEAKEDLPEASEAEKMKQEQDAKFQQWVKVNLEKSLSEPEENESSDQQLKLNLSKEPSLSRSVEFDEGLISKSPLQHYPTEFDLSMKTEPDWVELEDAVDQEVAEKEKTDLAEDEHDAFEIENQKRSGNIDNSDDEWEKIDLEIEMLEERQIQILNSQQKPFSVKNSATEQISSVTPPPVPKSSVKSESNAVLAKDKSPEVAIPKPPVRRRSKLNTAAIEEVLKNYEPSDEASPHTSDVPPALPLKRKDKSPENTLKDIYAVPDKHKAKTEEKTKTEITSLSKGKEVSPEMQAPSKPPRVNLSPSIDVEAETGEKKSLSAGFSKDASPVTSLSNESDSNCFADSESDPEIKIIRQKYMHRKAAKYENEEEDLFDETEYNAKLEEPESPSALRKEVELQSKAFEFDPELPIPIGTRGSRVIEIDEVESPKAFREGTARPLQLFKVTKQSSTEMTPEPTFAEQNKDIDTMVSGIVKAYNEHVSDIQTCESLTSELRMGDNQGVIFIPEPEIIPQDVTDPHYYNKNSFEQPQNFKNVQELVNISQAPSELPLEISDDLMPIEPIPEEPLAISYDGQQPNEEEEMAFTEIDGVSAAADYFFGRYNEVTVSKPKKRTPVAKGSKATTSPVSKVMSSSEIKGPPVPHAAVMEKSASPVMMPSFTPNASEAATNVQPQKAPRSPKGETKTVSVVEPPKEPEYLSFAEDYFFGSYNEVVVPKKGKKKIPPKPIPKAPEKVKVDEALPATNSVPQPESVSSGTSQITTTSSTTSPVSSALQHAESMTSLYFDTSSLMEDTFYLAETQEEPVDNETIGNNDRRVKSVHFEDAQPVVPPPRKNRPKLIESNISSVSSYTSAADEFMYEQYGQSAQLSSVDKKKLHPYSEDFKLNQESDPSDFSSESLLQPSYQQESVISSEISVCTSKDPSNVIQSPITGLFDKNIEHKLSGEFLIQELSASDKAKDFPYTLSQDEPITSDIVSNDKKFDENSLEIEKTSKNFEAFEFSKEDSLIITGEMPEDAIKSDGNVLAEQNTASGFTTTQISFDMSNGSKEAPIVDSEISEVELRLSEHASIDTSGEDFSKLTLKMSEDDSNFKMTPDNILEYTSDITEKEIGDDNASVSEDILISDSYTVKLEGGPIIDRMQDEESKGAIEQDTYSVHIDEDFEDGLLLVEEAENLINEFCDIYPPGIFDIASSNELQNLNTKNNKQESTYDSEHEWKLNEERYNSLNANFIENKLYKSKGSPGPDIADVKESLIIDTKTSAEGSEISDISLESTSSDLAGISEIGELVFASREDQMAAELESKIYSLNDPIYEKESDTESSKVNQTTSESISANVIQPLSVLCQEAASTVDFELSCSENLPFEHTQEAEDEEGVLESDYLNSELLDTSIDVSDESLGTSTRSSISTQIPIPSDMQIQDLVDELNYEVESKTPVQTAMEECEEILNIPLNTDTPEQTPNEEVALTLKTPLITDRDIPTIEKYVSIPPDDIDVNTSLMTGCGADISLKTGFDTDDTIVNSISTANDSIGDHLTMHLIINDDAVVSLTEPEEGNDVPMISEHASSEYDVLSDVYSSALQTQFEVSANREEIGIQNTNTTAKQCHEIKAVDSSEAFPDSSEIEDADVKISKDESLVIEADQVVVEENIEDSCSSLMSHFYDEWFENVKTSGKSSILQHDVRSKYAAYYNYAESSNSGSGSENEDFTQVDAITVSDSVSTQVKFSENEIKTSAVEEIVGKSVQKIQEVTDYPAEVQAELTRETSKVIETRLDQELPKEDSTKIFKGTDDKMPEEGSIKAPKESMINAKDEQSKKTTEGSSISTSQNIALPEQGKDLEVVTHDLSIEIKMDSDKTSQISLIGASADQYKETKSEKDIKSSSELSDVIPEKLDGFKTNKKIIESAGDSKKIYTTKSCQTDDSFEEDLFFDSFDDPLMDPSVLYLPIDKKENIEPVKIEIGIQCHIITEIDVSSDKTLDSLKSEIKTYKSEEIQVGKGVVNSFEEPMELYDAEKEKVITIDITTQDKDSSFEVSEDSDSDLFLEPHSSHDELDAEGKQSRTKSSFLCAEIDSGFSSGSDCGKRTYKQVTSSENLTVVSSTSGEVSVTHDNKSEQKIQEVTDYPTKVQVELTSETSKGIKNRLDQELSEEDSTKIFKGTVDKMPEEGSVKVAKGSMINSKGEQSKKTTEGSSISSSQNIAMEKHTTETEVSVMHIGLVKEDIFERAITPIAIEKVPSIEDLTFIELQTDIIEQVIDSETIVHSESCSTPTVEYFYGPLPESVSSEVPPENDYFVEALDLLDACASEITKNHVENVLASLAYDHSDSKSDTNIDSEDLSESLSSFHELEDDSLTESASDYFLPSDDEDKASLKPSFEEKNSIANLNLSICETVHVSSTRVIDQQSDLKIVSPTKSKEVKSIIPSSSSTLSNVNKKSTKEVIDKKSEDITESFSVEPDSLNEIDKTCDVSEFEDSLYLESTSEYSLPADTLSKHFEKITQPLPISSGVTGIEPQVEFSHQNEDVEVTYQVESLTKENIDYEAPGCLIKMQVEEQNQQPHTPELKEGFYSERKSENLSPEKSIARIAPEKLDSEVASDVQDLTTSVAPEDSSEKCLPTDRLESSVISIQKTLEALPDSLKTLETSSLHIDSSLFTSAVDESLYLESIPDYFAPEAVSVKTEKVESFADSQNVSEKADKDFHDVLPLVEAKINVSSTFKTTEEELKIDSCKGDIPPVPSDIVRYLYYGDDITFEEDSSLRDDTSFNSAHNGESISESGVIYLDNSFPFSDPEIETKAVESSSPGTHLISKDTCVEPISQDLPISIDEQSDEYKSIQTSSSDPECFAFAYSEHESTDQWYDLDATRSLPVHEAVIESIQKSESCTETNSLTKDDEDSPCIPELILEEGIRDNFPVAKVDSDEVTDISTHFTMTEDDSDKFSDIESDSSLQDFEADCALAFDIQSNNGVTKNENTKNVACSDSHQVICEIDIIDASKQENVSQSEVFLDPNANEHVEMPERACIVKENLGSEPFLEDILSPIRDVNGNVTEQQISIQPDGIEGRSPSCLQITSSSCITHTLEDEFYDLSQTTESCYTSPILDSDYWLDANNESILETEDSDFVLPNQGNLDAVGLLTSKNTIHDAIASDANPNLTEENTFIETEKQIISTQSKDFRKISSSDLQISSSSDVIHTPEEEFYDISQTTESCYTSASSIVKSDYWLDANNKNILEAEDSGSTLKSGGILDSVGLLTSPNNIPIDSSVITIKEESKEIVSSVEIRKDVIKSDYDKEENISQTTNIGNATENVTDTIAYEVTPVSEVIVLHDLSTNKVPGKNAIRQDLNSQESKDPFATDEFRVDDFTIKEIDPASPKDKVAINEMEVESANEMLVPNAIKQAVIPKEESGELYEIKETNFETAPGDADVLPSVVSDVIETECMLNFGNKEEISVPLEGKVCYEVPEESAVQIEPHSSLGRVSSSHDFISSDVLAEVIDNSAVLQDDAKRTDLNDQEETFSFSKFGYLFKEGKLDDTSDSFHEKISDSSLDVKANLQEESAVPKSRTNSDVDKRDTFSVTESEFLEESEQSIINMGQVSSILYPKTDEKQHIKDKESSYLSIESDDFDHLKKDSVSAIQPQEVFITDTSQVQEVVETLCVGKVDVCSTNIFESASDEVSQLAQLNEEVQSAQSLVSGETSVTLDRDVQEKTELPLEIKESVFKDEITDTSFRTLSRESDSWHEEDSEALVEDFPYDNEPLSNKAIIDTNRESVPVKLKDIVTEYKLSYSDEKQEAKDDGSRSMVSISGVVAATTLKTIDDNIQKEQSPNIESFSYSESDSANFYSACDELDNTSVITSDEDFTDVPSHFTLTEGSETWSDVETDASIAFDDCEEHFVFIGRDKTPTRDDGGYTFRDEDFYSFKGNVADEDVNNYHIENTDLEIKVTCNNTLLSTCPVSEVNVKVPESVTEEQEISLPQFMPHQHDSLLKGVAIHHDSVSLEGVNQESNISNIETSNIDINLDNFNVKPVMPLKKDNSDELSDFVIEESEQSSYSVFKSVSNDDESESFCDIESEIFEDTENNLKETDETFDFVPFAEESGKSTVKRNKNSKKLDLSKVETTVLATEKSIEQVSIVDGKRTLSLSIADIVEASELQQKTDETTETLLLEQFADIKSLSESLVLAETFPTFEPDTAVVKIHEDVGDVSLHLEMTEDSDYWLEAETEYSISEFEDEAVSFSVKDTTDPFLMDVNNVSDHHLYATSSQHSDATAAGISTTFYTDTDYSEQISDTCADISLQGGTTDNSDKWSDIEGDAAIDEALYGLTHASDTNKEDLNTASNFCLQTDQSSSKLSEIKMISVESPSLPLSGSTEQEEQLKLKEIGEKVSVENTSVQLFHTSEKSSDSVSESYTQPLSGSLACNLSVSGVSDEDFTSITPLDGTVDELDKFSDISNDSSVEEIQQDSRSVSVKSSTPPKVDLGISGIAPSLPTLEKDEENTSQVELAPGLISANEGKLFAEIPKNVCVQNLEILKQEDQKSAIDAIGFSFKDVAAENVVYEELILDTIQEDMSEAHTPEVATKEDSKEIATFESDAIDETGIYDHNNLSTSPPYENEDYENYDENFDGEEYLEEEEYDPNMEEHQMEFGDEDFPEGSVPYIENEDELVYPLQPEDWIGESFELKEYGIDYPLSGSETDVHGFGISDEYEDMQRAIDFNISNFDEAIDYLADDQNLTTESFKTISNNTPTQSKVTDKEHESWSTADADSIEDDLSEHDNVISKIDELLAEDFAYDHTDYYRDVESAHIEGNEEIQCLSPIEESFKIEDTEVSDFKTTESAELTGNVEENLKTLKESVKKDEDKKHSGTVSELQCDVSTASKHTAQLALSEETLIKQFETVPVKGKAQVISETESDSFKVKKSSQVVSDTGSIVEVLVKEEAKIISETKSDDFKEQKTSQIVSDTLSIVDSNFKISSEQTESLKVNELNQDTSESISIEESKVKISSDELKSFTVKKQSKAISETSSDIELAKISSKQSESFTASESVPIVSSSSKISTEKSESLTLQKPVQELSESIPVADSNSKVLPKKTDSLTVEKPSQSVSENVSISDSYSKNRQEDKKENNKSEISDESSKIDCKVIEQTTMEKLSKTDTAILQSQNILSKEGDFHSETGTAATFTKAVRADITSETEQALIKEEAIKLDLKTETEFAQSTVSVPSTNIEKPIFKEEISESKSNIPSVSKDQTEQLPSKTLEAASSSEQTDTTVRRRRVRTSQSTEEEPADSKPDIPIKRRRDIRKASISSADDDSKSSSSETSDETKLKPDIPEKRKRKPGLPKVESEPIAEKQAPSLPPKTIKRDSSSDSISSSVFLSSSSESLSCYESASLKDMSKSETATELEVPSVPEVPARKASIRQRRRESSEDTSSSSINRSSSSRRSYDLPPKESMDLCRKRTSIDERMVKLQAAGKCTTKETAFIAAKLIEMQFEEEDALLASRQCSSIYHAVKFLTQLCELCQCRFPINLMASMIHCAHRACKECLKAHFTNQIYDRSIFTLLCPLCHKPDITDQNIQEYFNHLEIMFRSMLDSNVYDLFQRKLRDEVLTKDPNFHWCSQCSSGFIASPRLKKLYCPDCSAITCALCHQTWELEHEGVHCERFQQWKDMHTPEPPPAGLVKFLTDRGITCPSCDINYAQACAGCMMYKCSHCSFEFCGFCFQPCKKGKDCGNKECDARGIHAHHPYSCLFFLRDKDISELHLLLDEESVKYLIIPPKDQIVKSRCQVREQKHAHGSITEDRCGRDIVPYCAGLCRIHYYEYLAELMRKNKINPLSLMTIHDLQFMLRKSRCPVPEKVKGESNEEFYDRLTETVSSTLS